MRRGGRVTRGQALLLAFVGLNIAAMFVLVTGIGPDLPGPRVREILGFAPSSRFEPCVPDAAGDRTPPLPDGVNGRWSEGPDLPDPRDELRAAAIGSRVYIAGGNGVDEDDEPFSLSTFGVFDARHERFRSLPDLPLGLDHPLVATHAGSVYVVGGASNGEPQTGLYRYDPRERSWDQLESMTVPRFAPAGAVIDGRLYVVGGAVADREATYASMEVYDFDEASWSSGPEMPTARHHAAAAALGDDLYVVGGRHPGDFSVAAAERYDSTTGDWDVLPPLPEGVGGPAATTADGMFVVTGGGDDLADGEIPPWVTGAVWGFEPRTERWLRLPDLAVPRHGHTAATADGRVIVFGGAPCAGYGRTESVEYLQVR